MFVQFIGILVLLLCAAVFVAHAIDAIRARNPPTFKYSNGKTVPPNSAGQQKP